MKSMIAALLIGIAAPATAHSWYPVRCCSGEDCAPVIHTVPVEGGKWVTSSRGTVFVPKTFRIDTSRDNDAHICMQPDPVTRRMKLLCYFEPGIF
jgi:hypothetical protein